MTVNEGLAVPWLWIRITTFIGTMVMSDGTVKSKKNGKTMDDEGWRLFPGYEWKMSKK